MAGRLDPRPLLSALAAGVRKRRLGEAAQSSEPVDWWTWVVLLGAPTAVLILAIALRVRLDAASELLAGAALLVGALVATFSQVAVWRERLLARDDTVGPMRIRALNEAAAHILLGTMASVGATVAIVTLVSFSWPCASVVGHWVQVALSSLTLGLFAYVVVTIMIVINLLWDAYQEEGTRAPRDLDE